jgi:hypothetical protein
VEVAVTGDRFKDFSALAEGSLGADALGDRLIDLRVSMLPVHRSRS